MIDCELYQLADGRWHCPRCDPEKKRLLPVKARRNCRVENNRRGAETRREGMNEAVSAAPRLRGEKLTQAAAELGITGKLCHYAVALSRWMAFGCPRRSKLEVAYIHSRWCYPCGHYNAERGICTLCGCRARREGMAVRNKIKMATEHCPDGKW